MPLRRSSKSQGKDKKGKEQESHELKTALKKENFESLPQDEEENPFAPVSTKPGTLVSPVGASSAHSDHEELLSPSSETHSGCSRQDEEADGETSQVSDGQRSKKERNIEEKLKKEAEKKERRVKRRKARKMEKERKETERSCLLYTSPSPRDATLSRMPSSA